MSEIEAVVAGLSEEKRMAILELTSEWQRSAFRGHATRSLASKGLIERQGQPVIPNFRLTRLGLAVRAYLERRP